MPDYSLRRVTYRGHHRSRHRERLVREISFSFSDLSDWITYYDNGIGQRSQYFLEGGVGLFGESVLEDHWIRTSIEQFMNLEVLSSHFALISTVDQYLLIFLTIDLHLLYDVLVINRQIFIWHPSNFDIIGIRLEAIIFHKRDRNQKLLVHRFQFWFGFLALFDIILFL